MRASNQARKRRLIGSVHRPRTRWQTFVDKLLGAECAAREQRTREAMLKLATLPSIKTLEGFDFAFAGGAPRKQITESS